jgi:23S rRNA (uracil1939-C5)-methyltransferase
MQDSPGLERLIIAHVGHRGDGVADTAEMPVYVPYALPGETVEVAPVARHPDRRHLIRVESPSAERVTPICRHFGTCGGCAIQQWAESPYRAWKRELVTSALAQAGLDAPVDELIDAHGAGRRRAVFHARRGTHDVLEVGFTAAGSHHVIGIDRCPVLAPGLDGAIKAAWAIAEALKPERKPLDIQVTSTEGGVDVDVRGSGPLSPARTAVLAQLAGSHRLARITRHGELIVQNAAPTVTMGRARVQLPPGSFLQATEAGELALAELVSRHIGRAKHVADLFCGVGPFALRVAEKARVSALDSDQGAVDALRRAVTTASGLKPVDAQVRDLFRRPLVASELKTFDAVVFDPPRQGAQAQAKELAASKVPMIVAVSCNAATFARDARMLVDGGYRLTAITPVDQFRYSAHVEIVAKFERR